MNKYKLQNIVIGVYCSLVALICYGCIHPTDVDAKLDAVESLMESCPDSALVILDGIDDSMLSGKKIKARYALLKSMALDKNYIDTTTFDVLQPAIDYYPRKGNVDEKLRTYYYQGRIYENMGECDLAMQSYLNGLENSSSIRDSLTLARIYVSQAVLYFKDYQINEGVENNLKAAEIYGQMRRLPLQFNSYLRALQGEIILENRHRADSIFMICKKILKDLPSLKKVALKTFLSYAVNFGDDEAIKNAIDEVQKVGNADNMKMNLAGAYTKIGEPERAILYLEETSIASDNILDSLTYWVVKTETLEKLGRDKDALESYRNYSRLLEDYHMRLFSNEFLFSKKKHEMEIDSMTKIHKRDNAIKWILAGTAVLLLVAVLIYYRYRMNRAGRLIAEGNERKLRLETENLQLERERLRLEAENLRLELGHLEDEHERLEELLKNHHNLSEEARQVVRERIEMLNGLFAKALTNEEKYGKAFEMYVKAIKKDKKKFQESIGKVMESTHPAFMDYLRAHDLTEREINYICLYAIGLRGKEIGNYLDLARHYNISTDIRRKLGLETNGKNLGPFIREMMESE